MPATATKTRKLLAEVFDDIFDDYAQSDGRFTYDEPEIDLSAMYADQIADARLSDDWN